MTDEQKEQFKLYGCACRCLLAMAHLHGNAVSVESLITYFGPKIPAWSQANRLGVTDTGTILDIARWLEVGNSFSVFINKDKVRELLSSARGALLFTEKKPEEGGSYSEFYHCALVDIPKTQRNRVAFSILHPTEQVTNAVQEDLPDEEIDRMAGYFALFY